MPISEIEWFFAEPVTRQNQTFCDLIQKRKSKHAVKARQQILLPFSPTGKNNFGVGFGMKFVASLNKRLPNITEIIDHPVKGNYKVAIFHRLVAARAGVDD